MAYNKRPYSYKYGWGVLNGYHYLEAAKNWKLVKPQAWAHSPTVHLTDAVVNELTETMMGGEPVTKAGITSNITITKRFLKDNNFARIEHVNVRVWIAHTKRGDVEVEITSPTGVKSVLGAPRRFDSASTGYPGWMFMSVKHWYDQLCQVIQIADGNLSGVNQAMEFGLSECPTRLIRTIRGNSWDGT
jgi:kexin